MQEEISEVVLILVGSTVTILLLVILVVISLFITQRRKYRHRKELNDMKNAYEREVLKTQLETQAQTFETASRELHDNVGTLISMAMVLLKSVPNSTGQNLMEVEKLLDEAMDTLRDISKSISPDQIHLNGLGHTIEREINRLNKSRLLHAHFIKEGEEFPIDSHQQIILFRIVQEAINNVIKHAEAKNLTVKLLSLPEKLSITVLDDGRGFVLPDGKIDSQSGSGIVNMTNRAHLINANLSILSKSGIGTTIQVDYPQQGK